MQLWSTMNVTLPHTPLELLMIQQHWTRHSTSSLPKTYTPSMRLLLYGRTKSAKPSTKSIFLNTNFFNRLQVFMSSTPFVLENLSLISIFICPKKFLSHFTFTIFGSESYIPLTYSQLYFIIKLILYKSSTHIPLIFSIHSLLLLPSPSKSSTSFLP